MGIEVKGIEELRALRDVSKKLMEVTSGRPHSQYQSAREYSVRVLGRSNSVVSSAIKYPESISDALLKDLGEKDPENFASCYERVLYARIKDHSPELVKGGSVDGVERAKMRETVQILLEAVVVMAKSLDIDVEKSLDV